MTDEHTWRKSSYSTGGNCVEVGSGWRKSSYSAGGNCVEAGAGQAVIRVRDTQLAQSPVLVFPVAIWSAFTAALKAA